MIAVYALLGLALFLGAIAYGHFTGYSRGYENGLDDARFVATKRHRMPLTQRKTGPWFHRRNSLN